MPEVLELFTELAAIPSPSGEERAVADVVSAYLRDCALEVDEDDAAAKIGATAGNLYTRIEATAPGTPIFLCAHLDTVPPTGRIEPVVDDEGVVRNAAGTILGAYDQAAPIGEVVLGAPYSQSIEVTFHGKASHAGMYPEEGRNAIAAAARAIADLRLGRVDEQS